MKLERIIDRKLAKKDKNGIWRQNAVFNDDALANQVTWEKIYNFNAKTLQNDRKDFFANKLLDHIEYIEKSYTFTKKTIYLEIGCGPGYIGEYLMKNHDCSFVGVDFNYPMLVSLRKYLKKKGFGNFVLIYADISHMPLKSNVIDYIYGGGVIEHFRSTKNILAELYRVLKKNGIAFNTVPAFNLFWLTRVYNSIPSLPFMKGMFEHIHENILQGTLLRTYHGYELSFPLHTLRSLYSRSGFTHVQAGSFAFHPSSRKLKRKFVRNIYFTFSKSSMLAPMYFIFGRK